MNRFIPFPIIKTDRLILRRIHDSDAESLFKMRSDSRMHEHTDTKVDMSIKDTMDYIERMNKGIDGDKWIIWAIEHAETGRVIGTISIWNFNDELESAELGYGIIPDYQGMGLMKEALTSIVRYGFNVLHLKTIDAYTEENNRRSIGLLERCKFNEANRINEDGYFTDKVYHMIVYRIDC